MSPTNDDRGPTPTPSWPLRLLLFGAIAAGACAETDGERPPLPAARLAAEPPTLDVRADARAFAPGPRDYDEARRELARLFAGPGRSLYCDCPYDADRGTDQRGCGIPADLGAPSRRDRVEWEHVVPASRLGRRLPEREGDPACGDARGRACLRIASARFRRLEGDLHNLRPAVGAINELRGSRALTEIEGKRRVGQCDFEVDRGRAEPRDAVKGDLARIYLDMDRAYPDLGIIDRRDRAVYERWSREDPVDPAECDLVRRIAAIQGRANQVVETACTARGIEPVSR